MTLWAAPACAGLAAVGTLLALARRATAKGPADREAWAAAATQAEAHFGAANAAAKGVTRSVVPVVPHWGRNVTRSIHLGAAAQDVAVDSSTTAAPPVGHTPITVLSGFLGAGKTSALKHLLENREGLKVGVIVNDVAAVNIDAQLIQNTGFVSGADTVQLQNGCACCSMQDELLASVGQLVAQDRFDHIVIELSGVAEPSRVQLSLDSAEQSGDPIASTLKMKNVVTLVDVSTFGELCISEDRFRDRADLGAEQSSVAEENVAMLLIEQIEAANLIILNKVDTVSSEDLAIIRAYIQALNKDATVITAEYGRVPPKVLLEGVVVQKPHKEEHHHEAEGEGVRDTPRDHEHDHDGHAHAHASECADPSCTDPSHHHEHADHEHACDDPTCTDPSHHHHHHDRNHEHVPKDTTRAKQRFGIDTYVYKARRPLNTQRLVALIEKWPVPQKSLLKDQVALLQRDQESGKLATKHPFAPLLRSKGFVWVTTNPRNRVEWVHAGKHFGMYDIGPWWANFTEDELARIIPQAELTEIKENQFDGEFGDRRVEIVFIGIGLDTAKIKEEMDKCLLTDIELAKFRKDLAALEKAQMMGDDDEELDALGQPTA